MIVKGINLDPVPEFVAGKFEQLKTDRKDLEQQWLDAFLAYQSKFKPIWDKMKTDTKRSARFVGEPFSAVESLHAKLLALIFPREDFLEIQPLVSGSFSYDDRYAQMVQRYLYQQMDQGGFLTQMDGIIRQLQIFGNVPVKVEWHQNEAADYPAYREEMAKWELEHHGAWIQYLAAVQKWQKAAAAAQQQGTEAPPPPEKDMPSPPIIGKRLIDQYPKVSAGDIFEFVQDPMSIDPDHPLVINHSWVPLATLKRLAQPNKIGFQVYENLDDLEEVEHRNESTESYRSERYNAFGMLLPAHKAVEVHEMWGTVQIPGDHDRDDLFVSFNFTVANRKTVIRAEPTFLASGRSPWVLARYREPLGGTVYAPGQLEKFLGDADLINVRANQLVDVVNYAANPERKAVDDGVFDPGQTGYPGKVWMLSDIRNLEDLRKDFSGIGISFRDLELLKNDFQRGTLSLSPLSGQIGESATKTALDSTNTASEVGAVARYVERETVSRILQMFMEFDSQFLTDDVKIRLSQGAPISLNPEIIREGWAVRARGAEHFMDQQEKIQNALTFLQLTTGNPVLLPAVKPAGLAEFIWVNLMGFTNGDKILNNEETATEILLAMLEKGLLNGGSGTNGSGSDNVGGVSGDGSGEGLAGQDPEDVARRIAADLLGRSAVGAENVGQPGGPGSVGAASGMDQGQN